MILLAVHGLATSALVLAAVWSNPIHRAVLGMAWGLILIWCIGGGVVTLVFKDRIRGIVQRIRWNWAVTFVCFCTGMALTEEAVTVTMTNLAPLFGVHVGQAYITASANYLDVVCLHSVVVFIPMFICWAILLRRIDFSPLQVMFLFGLTGTLAEMSFSGIQALASVGFWMYVYGLMVYLPAHTLPERPSLIRPRWWHYPLAVVLPFVFVIPVAGLISIIHPIKIHFPPIAG